MRNPYMPRVTVEVGMLYFAPVRYRELVLRLGDKVEV